MKRRTFAQTAIGLYGFAASNRLIRGAETKTAWIDCNVTMGDWPFRRTLADDLPRFTQKLRQAGLTQAWVGCFEGIFRNDVRNSNRLHIQRCNEHGADLLMPVLTCNPKLSDWRSILNDFPNGLATQAIRIYPNYHGYELTDSAALELFQTAADSKIVVQLVTQIEDERTQPKNFQATPVNLASIPEIVRKFPKLKLMVLNVSKLHLRPILDCPTVLFDTAMIEGLGGIEELFKIVSDKRLVFGSHAPLFYWESAKLKLLESELLDRQLAGIHSRNVNEWLNA